MVVYSYMKRTEEVTDDGDDEELKYKLCLVYFFASLKKAKFILCVGRRGVGGGSKNMF